MLRDLHAIEHRVTTTEIEAQIAELRAIHAHRPRYNRRSKPPKSPHWVKVTTERYPRLSMVRKAANDGCTYVGPFRSRRHAEMVVTAIWDAAPIRRCLTRGGKRSAACSFAQLGVALCPCDGSVPDAEYAAVVDLVRRGLAVDPAALLTRLEARMRSHAREQRFEEAALLRDRHRALGTALQRRRSWGALQRRRTAVGRGRRRRHVVVDGGHLLASWSDPSPAPLLPPAVGVDADTDSPAGPHPRCWWPRRPIFSGNGWTGAGVVIVESQHPLDLPVGAVPKLERLAGESDATAGRR